jgi:hypothetical protein
MMAGGHDRRRAARLLGVVTALLVAVGCSPTALPNTASAASPTATPVRSTRPSVAPSADPGQAALRGFIAFATDPKASYQGTFTGHQRASVTIVTITKGVLQVDGKNVLVRATFTFPKGPPSVVEHRFVKSTPWIRFDRGAWQLLRPFTAAQSMAAFAQVHGPADVRYLGPVKVGSVTLYKVRIPSAIVNPVMVPAGNLTDRAVTSTRFDVLVDAAGKPVRGDAEITGTGRVSNQLQEIAIDLAVTFSHVGDPVSIPAP